jgi:hypothetical protein
MNTLANYWNARPIIIKLCDKSKSRVDFLLPIENVDACYAL